MEIRRHLFAYFMVLAVHWSTTTASILKADAISTKCLADIDGQAVLKNVGENWITNDACIKHVCSVDDEGNPYEKFIKESCNTNCGPGFELREEPGKCCPECVKTKCKYLDKVYNIGDNWRAKDTCTLFECSEVNGMAIISTYKKLCPKVEKCLEEDLYEEDCCLKCRSRTSKLDDDINSDIVQESTYRQHSCNRECKASELTKTCKYTFVVEWYETLSKACYDCPYNLTDCNLPHCIVGDGARRSVLVVNRMMPGPSIEVCLGDTIVVDVKNRLLGESTTIHWHGLHQRETPYMDGVPHISQCPIQPHSTFRYTFKADHTGTHFWHSHTGMQRGDGNFGALIIRQPQDPHSKLYDFDLSEHVMILQDWAHMPGVSMFASHHHSIGDNKPRNILVNGKGRYYPEIDEKEEANSPPPLIHVAEHYTLITQDGAEIEMQTTTMMPHVDFVQTNDDINMKLEEESAKSTKNKRSIDMPSLVPLETFKVVKGYRYRFRVINAEFLNCPIAISIDNHTLVVINSDGYDFEPVEVSSVVTYAGERFDFIVEANQEIDNYWIRFKGLMDCDARFTSAHQTAILRYEGAINTNPKGMPEYNFKTGGIELNALNKGPGFADSLAITELDSLAPDDEWLTKKEPDLKFYIYYDFYPKDNPHFHVPNLYGFHQITNSNDNKVYTPQLNHISLKFPSSPLLPARDQIDQSLFCNETSLAAKGIDCRKEFCECSHVLQVPLGSIVEMVLIDEGVTYDANHPFHLHGNAFRVIGMDKIAKNISVESVRAMDEKGFLKRKLKRAPIKDTVTIPDGGYTIIRYKADNPGYWLFHCHIEFHAEIGMALVLKVGDHSEMMPVPKNFPTCSDYVPEIRANDGSGAAVRIKISFILLSFLILAVIVL